MVSLPRRSVSVILATYNEAENLTHIVPELLEHVRDLMEIIVVDDDSPDHTWEIAQALNDPRVKVIRRQGVRGLASAMMRGMMESRGDLVGWIDVDMPDQVGVLVELIAATEACDVAVASRFVAGGSDERVPLRVWASRLINGIARTVLGGGIRDYDSNVAVVRRSVFDKALFNPKGFGEYFIEFLYRCHRKGLRIREIPYRLTDRSRGVSKSAPNLWRFLVLGFGYLMRIVTTRLGRIE